MAAETYTLLNVSKHQTLLDSEGNKTAVLIPMEDYEAITKLYALVLEQEAFREKFTNALTDAKQIADGKKKGQSLIDFLDEC